MSPRAGHLDDRLEGSASPSPSTALRIAKRPPLLGDLGGRRGLAVVDADLDLIGRGAGGIKATGSRFPIKWRINWL